MMTQVVRSSTINVAALLEEILPTNPNSIHTLGTNTHSHASFYPLEIAISPPYEPKCDILTKDTTKTYISFHLQ